eukprot:5517859-Alexandrium_andersonii.AAC.1
MAAFFPTDARAGEKRDEAVSPAQHARLYACVRCARAGFAVGRVGTVMFNYCCDVSFYSLHVRGCELGRARQQGGTWLRDIDTQCMC